MQGGSSEPFPYFAPEAPDKVWVTDITCIRTYAEWLYPAAVMDSYSRQIVGWATRATVTSDPVLQALLAAVWKRKTARKCLSDSGRLTLVRANRCLNGVRRRTSQGNPRPIAATAKLGH